MTFAIVVSAFFAALVGIHFGRIAGSMTRANSNMFRLMGTLAATAVGLVLGVFSTLSGEPAITIAYCAGAGLLFGGICLEVSRHG